MASYVRVLAMYSNTKQALKKFKVTVTAKITYLTLLISNN